MVPGTVSSRCAPGTQKPQGVPGGMAYHQDLTAVTPASRRLLTRISPDMRTRATDISGLPVTDKLLLTPEEAADALSIGRSKLYELLASGALESVAIGSCRRIPRAALADFVEKLRSSRSLAAATTEVV